MKRTELYHHGVKGMRWGVWNEDTKARYSIGAKIRKTPEERGFYKIGSSTDRTTVKITNKNDAKWLQQTMNEGYIKTYNTAVDVVNNYLLPKINNEWKNVDIENDEVANAKYEKQVVDAFNDALNTVGNYAVYNSPSGELMISYNTDLKSGFPAIDIYSRNKETVRAKKLEEAEDRGLEKFNNDIDRLNKKFYDTHGLSEDYDLGKNKRLLEEYDNWMMDQYTSYMNDEISKIK